MRRITTSLVLALALGAVGITGAHADEQPTPTFGLQPRIPARATSVAAVNRAVAAGPVRLRIKLREGSTLRRDDASVLAPGELTALLAREGVHELRPIVAGSPASWRSVKAEAEQASGREQADLSLWLAATVDGRRAVTALAALNASPEVEAAMPAPSGTTPGVPISVMRGSMASAVAASTPDLTGRQGYLRSETGYGIDALAVRGLPGGRGENIAVTDIENGWDAQHEDLTQLARPGAVVTTGDPILSDDVAHGTAVMGELVGDENTGGVTGIIPQALPQMSHVGTQQVGYDITSAIGSAIGKSRRGDVILIEQHLYACANSFAPVEADPAIFDAIAVAVARGTHVIEPAGNGAQNLDAPCFADEYPARGDSGAIVVGGGAPGSSANPGERLWYTNYGSRVDVHGWGSGVVTTGYGAAFDGGTHRTYTDAFNGTSSASPIVAGAVGLISSVAEAKGVSVTPSQMRAVLRSTGTKRLTGQGIGVLPNVPRALTALGIPVTASTNRSDIVNGGFEKGATAWSGATSAISSFGYPAAHGVMKAALGGRGRTSTEYLETAVTVPAGGARVAYEVRVATRETSTSRVYDHLDLQVVDASGRVLSSLLTQSNRDASDGYQSVWADLTPWAGQSVRLRFVSTEDASAATTFLVDDVRLS